jgi:hypothetical protein
LRRDTSNFMVDWLGCMRAAAAATLSARLRQWPARAAARRLNGIMEFHAISHFADEKQMK